MIVKIILIVVFIILVLLALFCLYVLTRIAGLATDMEEQMEIERKLRNGKK